MLKLCCFQKLIQKRKHFDKSTVFRILDDHESQWQIETLKTKKIDQHLIHCHTISPGTKEQRLWLLVL